MPSRKQKTHLSWTSSASQPEHLKKQYHELLRSRGLIVPPGPSKSQLEEVVKEACRMSAEADFAFFPDDSDLLDKLNKLAERSHGIEPLLTALRHEIEAGMRALNLRLATHVFVGELPTQVINAITVPVNGGVLVLFNSGTYMFLGQLLRIITSTMDIDALGNKGVAPAEILQGYSKEAIRNVTDHILMCSMGFLCKDISINSVPSFPAKMSNTDLIWYLLLREVTKFILAHEYSHAVSDNTSSKKKTVLPTESGDINVIFQEWDNEYRADATAALIVAGDWRSIAEDPLSGLKTRCSVTAPALFFRVDEMLQRIKMKLNLIVPGIAGGQTENTHPPGEQRSKRVHDLYSKMLPMDFFNLMDYCVSWLSFMERALLQSIDKGMVTAFLHKMKRDQLQY